MNDTVRGRGMTPAGQCPEPGCGANIMVVNRTGKIRRHSPRGVRGGDQWCRAGGQVHPRWMSEDEMEMEVGMNGPSALADITRLIGRARVQFWQCLVPEHRERRNVVTVEWDDAGVAHCTMEGCELTSEHTTAYGKQVAAYVRTQERQRRREGTD